MLGLKKQPLALSQPSVVQGFRSSQTGGAFGMHRPVAASQTSAPLHALPSSHCVGTPAQMLFAQTSPVVQRLLSLHGAVFGKCTQPKK